MTAVESQPIALPRLVSENAPWPVPDPVMFHGVAGRVVNLIEPATEADPVAILSDLLVCYGSAVGPVPHALVEQHKHHANLFLVQIGKTGKGRKGSSYRQAYALMEAVDPTWAHTCTTSGLSTGEGLIQAVRDRTDGENGQTGRSRDPRVLVVEEEFGSTLALMARDGNTLSGVLRRCWDGGIIKTLTRADPLTATNPHISIIGHATIPDVEKHLTENDTSNGFANRFLWLCVRRSKELPDGGPRINYSAVVSPLHDALQFGRSLQQPITRDRDASALWHDAYSRLSEDRPGLIGAITGRAEAQTLRLSLIYALLDCSPVVQIAHLQAALAVWRYCEDSARFIFGGALGDPVAEAILTALRDAAPGAVSQTDLSKLLGGHVKATRIKAALRDLQRAHLVAAQRIPTAGATRTEWFALPETGTYSA